MSGGGSKGAFEAGALVPAMHFIDKHFPGHTVKLAGVSTGAVNAAGLASEGIEVLWERWKTLRKDDVTVEYPLWKVGLRVLRGESSFYSNTPLKKYLRKHLNLERIKKSPYEVEVGIVTLGDGRFRMISKDEPNFINAVIASTAIPVVWPPQEWGGHPAIDGGAAHITPFKSALDCDFVIVILTTPREYLNRGFPKAHYTAIEVGKRALDIQMEAAFKTDLARFEDINLLLEHGAEHPDFKYVPHVVIAPEEGIGAGTDYGPFLNRQRINKGFARASAVLGEYARSHFSDE